jgi:hypothetical protein
VGLVAVAVRAALPQGAGPRPAAVASRALPAPVRGAVGSPMRLAGLRLTVLGVDPGALPPPSARMDTGDRFVTVRLQYQADGGGPAIVSPYDWVVSDASGATYAPVTNGVDGALPDRELARNQGVRGQVGFVVPRTAQGLVLHFGAERGDESAQVALAIT